MKTSGGALIDDAPAAVIKSLNDPARAGRITRASDGQVRETVGHHRVQVTGAAA